MAKIRVVLADDSRLARDMLRGILENDGDIEVVGEAANGVEAVRLARELRPDLLTMDLDMPVMDGMDAIVEIMASCAVPILVVSSVNDARTAYAAVARGALDAINKPEFDAVAGAEFVAKVKMLSQVLVIKHLRPRSGVVPSGAPAPLQMPNRGLAPHGSQRVFAIAASTGGPQTLGMILGTLPSVFPCAILISQHIADGFAAGLAAWLASVSKLPVRLAREGEAITAGTAYISPSQFNLAVTRSHRLTLAPRLPGEIYHPTCDVLLESVSAAYGPQAIGVILTGMGSDGAAGIEKIRRGGGATLAQDEASSVIFGMNKVAIQRGGVQQVLPANEIPAAMCRLAGLSA